MVCYGYWNVKRMKVEIEGLNGDLVEVLKQERELEKGATKESERLV